MARQLQKKQLSNQIQQLQQQLVHKAQEQQAVVSFVSGSQPSTAAAVNGFAATNQVSYFRPIEKYKGQNTSIVTYTYLSSSNVLELTILLNY